MLNTVEEIEQEIARLLEAHEDELLAVHERMDFITQQSETMLEDYEQQLNAHYAEHCSGYDEEEYKEEYLEAYRKAKQNILEGTKVLLQKEAENGLAKVRK